MNRAFTFSDPKVIERLQTEFIPFTGDMHDLQNGRSVARDWFMRMAVNAKPSVRQGNTSQGFYIVAADGMYYGFINHHDPERVYEFMSAGLEWFRQRPPKPVAISGEELDAAFTRTPPLGASVVRVFSRIRPLPQGADPTNKNVGRDHLWILADEVREIIAASGDTNQVFEMPRSLVARIVRFHLEDNVRGEPDMWDADQVRKAKFTARMTKRAEAIRTFVFSGVYAQQTSDSHRGLEGKIEGEFDIDTRAAKIVRFRAYGEGQAWGEGRYTGGAPEGRFPIVFAMIETDDAASKIVPPQGMLWRDYLTPQP